MRELWGILLDLLRLKLDAADRLEHWMRVRVDRRKRER